MIFFRFIAHEGCVRLPRVGGHRKNRTFQKVSSEDSNNTFLYSKHEFTKVQRYYKYFKNINSIFISENVHNIFTHR